MEPAKKTYFEYLDSLRCIAFLAVFYAHTGTIMTGANVPSGFPLNLWFKFTVYGSYGVNFFFVLSGFLITYLLLKEKLQHGAISIKKFYLRRVLRIWPVYFMTLVFAVCILPFLISSHTYEVFKLTNPNMSWSTILPFIFFLGNMYQGLGFGIASLSIGILWSVAVEEQFYLVWPWIVQWFSVRKLALVTVLLISLSLLYKYIWADDRLGNYYLPWSVGMDLAFGALLGIFYFKNQQRKIVTISIATIIGSLLLIIGALGLTYITSPHGDVGVLHSLLKGSVIESLRLVKTPLIDCVFILLLLFFIRKTARLTSSSAHPVMKFFHVSKKKVLDALIYLGKISYGLYAYHTICLMLTVHVLFSSGFLQQQVSRTTFFVTIIVAFILTIIVAHLSSKYVEQKLLVFKNKIK